MGDLNSEENDDPVKIIRHNMIDSKSVSGMKPNGPSGTFNGFEPDSELNRRIDFIFISS